MKLRKMLSMAMASCMMLSAMAFSAGAVTGEVPAQDDRGMDVYVIDLSKENVEPKLVASYSVAEMADRGADERNPFSKMTITDEWYDDKAEFTPNGKPATIVSRKSFQSGDDCLGVYVYDRPSTLKTTNIRLHKAGDSDSADAFFYDRGFDSSTRSLMLYFVNGEHTDGRNAYISSNGSYYVYSSTNSITSGSLSSNVRICAGVYNG